MPSIVEIAKRHHGDARLPIVERLVEENSLFRSAEFVPANAQTEHVYNERSVYPTPTWRGLNEGVTPANSQTEKKKEALTVLESIAQFDVRELEAVSDSAAYKEDEIFAHVDSISQNFATKTFYGTGNDELRGLSSRTEFASIGDQVINADGTGSALSSAWVIAWKEGAYYAYAKNSIGGVDVQDLGVQYVTAGNGGLLRADLTNIGIYSGLVVPNSRMIARIANIDTTITSDADLKALTGKFIDGINRLQFVSSNIVIYVNKSTAAVLEKAAAFQSNLYYSDPANSLGGNGRIGTIRGIPVQVIDMLTTTESALS